MLDCLLMRNKRLLRRLVSSRLLQALVLGIALSAEISPAMAQALATGSTTAATEERVKAAYLLRFISYVEWPSAAFAKPDSPFVVGVLRDEGVADELVTLAAGRLANNRAIVVKHLQENDSLNGLHMLFIGASDSSRQAQWLKSLQQQPVLLVTETDGALAQGSMINFRIVEDRVRFEIALAPAERSGLKFNSRLLGVALAVNKGQQ